MKVIPPCPRDRSEGPYQPLLPGSQWGNSQVIAALIKGVDVDPPVGVGLLEPVLQHVLKVNTLPVANPGVELYLQGADADVAAALLRDGLQPEDLQVDGGGLLQRSQVHPQLGLQHLCEHQFGAKLEEAAARLPIHLHQGLRCGKQDSYIYMQWSFIHINSVWWPTTLKVYRVLFSSSSFIKQIKA